MHPIVKKTYPPFSPSWLSMTSIVHENSRFFRAMPKQKYFPKKLANTYMSCYNSFRIRVMGLEKQSRIAIQMGH
jgi:hypothetical protein